MSRVPPLHSLRARPRARLCTPLALLALLLACSTSGDAHADERGEGQPGAAATVSAAQLFDEGVRAFQHAQYAEAVRQFLAADQLAPSAQALTNAMAAARRAGQPLTAARVAEQVLNRPQSDAEAVALAHQVLAEVAPQLARIEAQCSPTPCQLLLDGEPMPASGGYAAPGAHVLEAVGGGGTRAREHLRGNAGSVHKLSLKLPEPSAALTMPAAAATRQAAAPPAQEPEPPPLRRDPRLSKGVFYGCGAATLLFVGLTTWSGLEARSALDLHEEAPAEYDRDEVERLARRTNLFLASSVIFASATVATGIWWVDWTRKRRTRIALVPGRTVTLVAHGEF